MQSNELLTEFIKALDEEIEAIKAGKSSSTVKVNNGQFVRESSGIFVYSFMLENFIAVIDDVEVDIEVGNARYKGHIIQTQGLEVIIGIQHDLGPSVPEARLITKLYFLHENLKKKLEAVNKGKLSGDLTLANLVFESSGSNLSEPITLPPLEPHPKVFPNDSQLEAIKLSQGQPFTLVWGPPGTGKTETLARTVECFIKQSMKVLVVAHSNAAVDEAMEDIAEVLKRTEYYNQGQLIRFGNYQKKTLETEYSLVLPEKIAEKLGTTLKHEKDQLEQEAGQVERNLVNLASALETIREKEAISRQWQALTDALTSINTEEGKIKIRIARQEGDLGGLKAKLIKAESSGAVKRFFSGLDPVKIQYDIDQKTIILDGSQRELTESKSRLKKIEKQKEEVEGQFRSIQKRIDSLLKSIELTEPDLQKKEQELNAHKNRISTRLSEVQKELDELQKGVLANAKVICTTLTKTFSAKEFPETPFDVLVLDEASMAPMPYLYWALSRCQNAAVIAGDFLQLPPICISQDSMAQKWLGRSIYQHLDIQTVEKAEEDHRVCLLGTQYRMNPLIAEISNRLFYKGRLHNDISTHKNIVSEGLSDSPLTIIDTSSASPWCSRVSSGGRFNIYSALLAATTAKNILQTNSHNHCQVGVISPYSYQARLIGKILKDMGLERQVRASTIHRFQGGEEQIIIFDTTEGPGAKIAPMLDDTTGDPDAPLLLNVAMTRAKCKIFLICNLEYLKSELSTKATLYKIMSAFEQKGQRIESHDLVDSYFVRDFERWIERFLEIYRSGAVEPPDGSLFTEKNFYPAFFQDLQKVVEEVIILSPFISTKRSGQFVELFRLLINKGVKVKLFTRSAKQQTSNFALNATQVIEQMRAIGVEVIERRRMHQKVAIIDRSIAWEGSLNILSHNDSNEQMRRLPFATAVNELIRLCELEDTALTGSQGKKEAIKTFEECPECRKQMVIRVSKYGPFLSCPERSCPGKGNIRKWDKIQTHVLCPDCGQHMILRRGPKGSFLGCSGYPNCKKTLPIR